MRLYKLEPLAQLYLDEKPRMSRKLAMKRAEKLRRHYHRRNRNWSNSVKRFRDRHVLVGLMGDDPPSESDSYLSSPAYRTGPCDTPWIDPEDDWCAQIDLQRLLDSLSPVPRRIAEMITEQYTEREMAEELGLSRVHVRRLRDRMLTQLRQQLEDR